MKSFIAQLKQVQAKTTASGDKEYSVRLITDDPSALELGLVPSDKTVRVTIVEDETL